MLMNSNLHPVTTHKKMGSSGKAANYTGAHQPRFSQESRTSPEWGCVQRAPRVGKENTETLAVAKTKKNNNPTNPKQINHLLQHLHLGGGGLSLFPIITKHIRLSLQRMMKQHKFVYLIKKIKNLDGPNKRNEQRGRAVEERTNQRSSRTGISGAVGQMGAPLNKIWEPTPRPCCTFPQCNEDGKCSKRAKVKILQKITTSHSNSLNPGQLGPLECRPLRVVGRTDRQMKRWPICCAVLTLGGSVLCGSEDPVVLDSSWIYMLSM